MRPNTTLNRRQFLHLTGLAAAGLTVQACAPVYDRLADLGHESPAGWPPRAAADFVALSRMTFGPRAAERLHAAELGLAPWIEEQLAPDAIDDWPAQLRVRRFDTLAMAAHEIVDRQDKLFDEYDRAPAIRELQQATLLRQVYSRRQLYEVLVEFWSDHFNISVDKGDCWFLKTVDDRETIRAHAMGNFRELLWVSAHSPAMLVYLDNQVNDKRAPNENYARELLELHTLGVNGGYSQRDIMQLARCLTGWTVKEHFWRGQFTFDAERHAAGDKQVLGQTIPAGGVDEGERVLDILASEPATARFISGKLARRFLGASAPPELVARAAETFRQTDGDIRATLRVILLDGLPLAEGVPGASGRTARAVQPKYKRPLNFIVSALRMLEAQTDGGDRLHDYLAQLGQPLFRWPTPDGYADEDAPWQGNLLPRWLFAFDLLHHELGHTTLDLEALLSASGAKTPPEMADQLGTRLLGAPLPLATRDNLLRSLHTAGAAESDLPAILTAGLLASPAFQWR